MSITKEGIIFTGFGISHVLFFTILAWFDIGKIPSCENYPWYLPFIIFIALSTPFIAGFVGGYLWRK